MSDEMLSPDEQTARRGKPARRTAGASYKQLAAEFNLTVKQVGSILNVHRKRLASDPPWIKAERDDTINKGVK